MPPLHRRSLPVTAVEAVGAYTLLRLRNDGGDAGGPGQFFMLQADPEPAAAYLPRALSAAWASEREIAFLIDTRGEGTRGAGRRHPHLAARPARQRLSDRRRAGPAGRRRDRRRGASLAAQRARRCRTGAADAARIPHRRRTPSARRWSTRTPRSSSSRCWSPSRLPACSPSRARSTPAARIRCCRRWPPSAPSTMSGARWPWRRRWPAGLAPATAARCASTAPGDGSASRGRCWSRADPCLTDSPASSAASASRTRSSTARGRWTRWSRARSGLGAYVTKTITLRPREGNAPQRIAETPAGMVNSIGLANPGLDAFCSSVAPRAGGARRPARRQRRRMVARRVRRGRAPGLPTARGGGSRAERVLPQRRHRLHLDRQRPGRDASPPPPLLSRERPAAAGEAVAVGRRRGGDRRGGRRGRGGRPRRDQHRARHGDRPRHTAAAAGRRRRRPLRPGGEAGRHCTPSFTASPGPAFRSSAWGASR